MCWICITYYNYTYRWNLGINSSCFHLHEGAKFSVQSCHRRVSEVCPYMAWWQRVATYVSGQGRVWRSGIISMSSSIAGPHHRVHTLWLPWLLWLRLALSTLDSGLRRFLPVAPPPSWEQRAVPQARVGARSLRGRLRCPSAVICKNKIFKPLGPHVYSFRALACGTRRGGTRPQGPDAPAPLWCVR